MGAGLSVDEDAGPARRGPLRALALLPLGVIGPFGGWLLPTAYLVIPPVAGLHLADRRPERYLRDDGPRVAAALEWLLWVRAYGMLVVARPPLGGAAPVRLALAPAGRPTTATAMLRLLTGLPVALALFAAGTLLLPAWIAGGVWLAARGALPGPVRALHLALLRAEAAFLARHASLVGVAETGYSA